MNVNEDWSYAFTLSYRFLRILGIWPDPYIPLNRLSIRFMIITCIMTLYVFAPQMMNVIRAWGNVTRMVENFVSANFSLMALCKLIITWYYGGTLRTLMISVMADWTITKKDWERNTMLKIARRGRSLSFRCCIAGTAMVLFYLRVQLLRFYRSIHEPHRSLVYRFESIQKSPNYEITYFIQLFAGIYSLIANYAIDSFVSILVLHVCAQLINLRTTINNLVAELSNRSISYSKFREGLATIAMRHEHLIRNAKTINNCYSAVLFIHMLTATFLLCFLTFQVYTIITDNVDVSVIKMAFLLWLLSYFFFILMHLYMYCYSAERLLTESTSMGYGVYECKWYDLPSKDAKDLMFIIYRSMIPLRLTTGKFGIFSLEMFGTVIKTSMGYLSALVTMRD